MISHTPTLRHALPAAPITQSMIVHGALIGLGAIAIVGAARYGLRKIGVID